MIIFLFPSEAAAEAWYNDPEYQELSKFRRDGAPLRSLSMVKGHLQGIKLIKESIVNQK